MNNFMVSNTTLCILASYLAQVKPPETCYAFHYERDNAERIYETLRDMNHKALYERYGGEKAQEMMDINEYEFIEIENVSDYIGLEEFIIRLECFLYQCQDNLMSKTDNFKALVTLAGNLARAEIMCEYRRGMAPLLGGLNTCEQVWLRYPFMFEEKE